MTKCHQAMYARAHHSFPQPCALTLVSRSHCRVSTTNMCFYIGIKNACVLWFSLVSRVEYQMTCHYEKELNIRIIMNRDSLGPRD